MSDAQIFLAGCLVSLLCAIFAIVTINEFRKM